MRVHGRIPVCGMISHYNPTQLDGVTNLANLIFKRVKMEDLLVNDFYHLYPKFLEFVQTHIREGKVVYVEGIVRALRMDLQRWLASLATAMLVNKCLFLLRNECKCFCLLFLCWIMSMALAVILLISGVCVSLVGKF